MRSHRLPIIATLAAGFLALAACQNKSDLVLQEGYAALEQKQFDRALSAADQYLSEHPQGRGAAEATYLRGRAIEQRVKIGDQRAQNDLREARELFEKSLTLRPPRNWEGYILTSLADVCYWQNDYATAETHWRSAYDKIGNDAVGSELKGWVLYRIALCQQRLGQFAKADETFKQVQETYKDTETARRAASRIGVRHFYVQVGAFQNPTSADRLTATLREQGFPAQRMTKAQQTLQFVLAGPLPDYLQANAMRTRLVNQGYHDAMIVP